MQCAMHLDKRYHLSAIIYPISFICDYLSAIIFLLSFIPYFLSTITRYYYQPSNINDINTMIT